ncbi:MAG: biotin/lipoyl-binding protein [Candidatus Taylorbacteria bacterium]|nr:biotin/lipoyl-binding protein [Candidatus Taylorbacteria bacterium]
MLNKPKTIIPVTLIIAIIIGAISYNLIGKPPIVTLSSYQDPAASTEMTPNNSTDLALLKSGRLATGSVHVGDAVKKGDILATLEAGDALGAVNQAKGALELAKAQYASLDTQDSHAKTQQDVLVANAYRTLLSSGLSTLSCGISIQFPVGYFSSSIKWVIDIPNTRASNYALNKNAYDLAIATRDQVLRQFEANLGKNGSSDANIAQANIDSAEGAYEIALAAYKNTILVAPIDGVVSFVDPDLKIGQTVAANKTLITIAKQ